MAWYLRQAFNPIGPVAQYNVSLLIQNQFRTQKKAFNPRPKPNMAIGDRYLVVHDVLHIKRTLPIVV